jgi:hypothetical protein
VLLFRSSKRRQYKQLATWAKSQLLAGRPVIFGGFVYDCDPCSSEYDHIMPITGFRSAAPSTRPAALAADELIICSLYASRPVSRTVGSMPGAPVEADSYQACEYDTLEAGCMPLKKNYGVAIKGIRWVDPGVTVACP